jgi:hypothetical protein
VGFKQVRPAAIAVSLTVAAALCAASGTAGLASAAASVVTAGTGAAAAARPFFLINGDQADTTTPRTVAACMLNISVSVTGNTGPLQTLTVGGRTYAIPATALPYLGHGLDLSLFDLNALAAAETSGRLPVRVTYPGQRPGLPGVTLTGSHGGTASGYLTQAGARRFGATLARQFADGRARGTYGQNGLFARGVSIALGGRAPAAPGPAPGAAPRPAYPMDTVTVDGTNLAGKPDSGDFVWIFNADDAARFDDPAESENFFDHGVTKFSVPAGHYWAVGDFLSQKGQPFGYHLAVLPEFTVGRGTTVQVDARTADSKIQFVTPRPASVQETYFSLIRSGASGLPVALGWLNTGATPASPVAAMYISPTRAAPTVGTLTDITSAQLGSPSTAKGVPYVYDLAHQTSGVIPAQRFVVNQASLATENARFYSAAAGTGLVGRVPVFPLQAQTACYVGSLFPTPLPASQTVYLSAGRALLWLESYIQSSAGFGSGGQVGAPLAFAAGQRMTEDWGAYPLHPEPNARVTALTGPSLVPVSASRAGNTLRLAMTAFSDSVTGHTGYGVNRPYKAAGSYEIDQNGTKVAGGALAHFDGSFEATATLGAPASVIKFTLSTSEPGRLNPLSTASQTVWTWQSAHESGVTLPAGWTCLPTGQPDRSCAVQPMRTLGYDVAGLGLNGTAGPGQQTVRLTVGQLQLTAAAKITGTAMSASFDGGKTWHAARVTGSNGSYVAVFNAPAGAMVTLRTSAADAAGSSVTETITNAYQIAS